MKPILFLGDSLTALRSFSTEVRADVGYQLRELQSGNDPSDWKPMASVGQGVRELRIRDASGAFRVIYLASLPEAVLVLHVFQKKTQKTPQRDIELASNRLRTWIQR